jgi:protein SCO1
VSDRLKRPIFDSYTGMPIRQLQTIAIGCFLLAGLVIAVAFVAAPASKPLPILGAVGDFSLTDQDGRKVSLDDLGGQIWIADLIFTRCPGPCLVMSGHMKDLQARLDPHLPVKLVSLTTDPEFDTAPVLKKYGNRFGAQDARWLFLTGPKPTLHRLAVDSLKLTMIEKDPAQAGDSNDLFIHSEKLVLVDGQGRIRGYFDGETTDCIPQLAATVKILLNEH